MFKKILAVIAVIVVAFVAFVATRPNEFHIARSLTMAAPPDVVFAQVNVLHNWGGWDPWAKLDPNSKSTFEGPSSGTGAVMAWDGNNEVGKGRVTVTDSKPGELVRMKLEFEKPMKATNIGEFTFKADGAKTTVTWAMSGENNFIAKAMCLFMNMDKMVGGQFEKGLAAMKSIVEAPAAK